MTHAGERRSRRHGIEKRLECIEAGIATLLQLVQEVNMTLDDLKVKVDAERGVVDSAIVLINGLGDLIRATAGDPAKVQALADEVDKQSADLGAAVAANPLPTP